MFGTGSDIAGGRDQKKRRKALKFLKLPESASQEEIKKRYRELALRVHPDKHQDKSKEEVDIKTGEFKELSEAYGILTRETGVQPDFNRHSGQACSSGSASQPSSMNLSERYFCQGFSSEECDLFSALLIGDIFKTKSLLEKVKNINLQVKGKRGQPTMSILHYVIDNYFHHQDPDSWKAILEGILSRYAGNNLTPGQKAINLDILDSSPRIRTPLYFAFKLYLNSHLKQDGLDVINMLIRSGAKLDQENQRSIESINGGRELLQQIKTDYQEQPQEISPNRRTKPNTAFKTPSHRKINSPQNESDLGNSASRHNAETNLSQEEIVNFATSRKCSINDKGFVVDRSKFEKYKLSKFKEQLSNVEFECKEVQEGFNPEDFFEIAEVAALEKDGKNYGVFVTREIEKGKKLGTYEGRKTSEHLEDKSYAFNLGNGLKIDATFKRNWTAYVNHGHISNVEAIKSDENSIVYYASKNIPKGSQLLLDYGRVYFEKEKVKKVFLHPTDNNLTPYQLYEANKELYHDEVFKFKFSFAKILGYDDKTFYVIPKDSEVNLPILAVKEDSSSKWKFLECAKQENMTNLMVACYYGNQKFVGTLLGCGAEVLRHTLHSGLNSLSFTVLGKAEPRIKSKILNKLLENLALNFYNNSEVKDSDGFLANLHAEISTPYADGKILDDYIREDKLFKSLVSIKSCLIKILQENKSFKEIDVRSGIILARINKLDPVFFLEKWNKLGEQDKTSLSSDDQSIDEIVRCTDIRVLNTVVEYFKRKRGDVVNCLENYFLKAAVWHRVDALQKLLEVLEQYLDKEKKSDLIKRAFTNALECHEETFDRVKYTVRCGDDGKGEIKWDGTGVLQFLWQNFDENKKKEIKDSLDESNKKKYEKIGEGLLSEKKLKVCEECNPIIAGEPDKTKKGKQGKNQAPEKEKNPGSRGFTTEIDCFCQVNEDFLSKEFANFQERDKELFCINTKLITEIVRCTNITVVRDVAQYVKGIDISYFRSYFFCAASLHRVDALRVLLTIGGLDNKEKFNLMKETFVSTLKEHNKPFHCVQQEGIRCAYKNKTKNMQWDSTGVLQFLWQNFNKNQKKEIKDSLDESNKEKYEKIGEDLLSEKKLKVCEECNPIIAGEQRCNSDQDKADNQGASTSASQQKGSGGKEKYMGLDSQDKNSKKQKNSPQQSNSSSGKKKAEEVDSSQQKYNLRERKIHSGYSDKKQQEAFLRSSEFISHHFPNASIQSVRQGLYFPSFEERGVKIDGKCTAITRSLSQALLLQSDKSFLSNLETSAEIYERMAQGKQVSKREGREVFAFSKLLDSFERKLDSSTISLPSNLIHTKGYKTFSDLSNYTARIEGDFAIHLVTNNHVVAIYRTDDNYAYFDSNVAFVSGLKSADQLIEVVEKGVEFAGYEVGEKGFLVEHFDVEQANKLLSNEDKEVITKEIKTERQLLVEQDKELGPIKSMVNRVQLYDFGTKINVEGGIPLLINANMNSSSKKFQDHLDKKEVSMTAKEYLDSLKNGKNMGKVVQATKVIPFIGSKREVEEAEQTRKPKRPLLEQLVKGAINFIASNLTIAFFTNVSQLENQLSESTDKTDNNPKTCLSDITIDDQLRKSLSF